MIAAVCHIRNDTLEISIVVPCADLCGRGHNRRLRPGFPFGIALNAEMNDPIGLFYGPGSLAIDANGDLRMRLAALIVDGGVACDMDWVAEQLVHGRHAPLPWVARWLLTMDIQHADKQFLAALRAKLGLLALAATSLG